MCYNNCKQSFKACWSAGWQVKQSNSSAWSQPAGSNSSCSQGGWFVTRPDCRLRDARHRHSSRRSNWDRRRSCSSYHSWKSSSALCCQIAYRSCRASSWPGWCDKCGSCTEVPADLCSPTIAEPEFSHHQPANDLLEKWCSTHASETALRQSLRTPECVNRRQCFCLPGHKCTFCAQPCRCVSCRGRRPGNVMAEKQVLVCQPAALYFAEGVYATRFTYGILMQSQGSSHGFLSGS